MKVRKTGKSSQVRITFGERDEAKKIQKISDIKATSKIGRQITKGVYAGGKSSEDVRKVVVKVKGGYSRSSQYRRQKLGLPTDQFYYFSYPTPVDKIYTPKEILNSVAKEMENFTELEPSSKAGSGPQTAAPRIAEITIDYVYM